MKTLLLVLLLVQIPAQRGFRVSGRVVDGKSGAAAASAVVTLSSSTGTPKTATTNSSGAFQFTGVLPGQYTVSATKGSLRTQDSPVEVGDRDEGGFGLLLENLPPVARVSGASITGRLVGSDGKPAPGASLSLYLGNSVTFGNSRADGTFEFPGLRPGTYSLTAQAGTARARSEPVVVGDRNVSGLTLNLVAADTAPPLHGVTGQVIVEGGDFRSIASPQLRVRLESGPELLRMEIASDGTFAISARPYEYKFSLEDLPVGYYVKGISGVSWDPATDLLRMSLSTRSMQVTIGYRAK